MAETSGAGLATDEELQRALAEAESRTLTFQQHVDAVLARIGRPRAERASHAAATLLRRARVNLVRVQAFLAHPDVPVSQLTLPPSSSSSSSSSSEEQEEEQEEDEDEEDDDEEEDEEEEEEEEGAKTRFGTDPRRVAGMWQHVLEDAEAMVARGYDRVFVEVGAFVRERLSPAVRAHTAAALAACVEEAAVARHLRTAARHLARVEALQARGRRPPAPALAALAADTALLAQTYPHNPAVAAFLARARTVTAAATSAAQQQQPPRAVTASAARQAAQCRRYVERVLAASERARVALETRLAREQQRTDAEAERLLALPEFARRDQ